MLFTWPWPTRLKILQDLLLHLRSLESNHRLSRLPLEQQASTSGSLELPKLPVHFSNSLIIHKKYKGNSCLMSVWKSDEKILIFSILNFFLLKSFCLRSNIKHSTQCFITRWKTSKFDKILRCASWCFIWWWNIASRVWYITYITRDTHAKHEPVLGLE